MGVRDINGNVGECLQTILTRFTKIHVSLAKWNLATMIQTVLMVCQVLIPSQCGWSSETAKPRFTISNNGPYLSRRISLILLHTLAKCLIPLSISTSLEPWKAYRICIRLITEIVLHPHMTLLCPLPDLWLTLFVKFLPYIIRAFCLNTDPAMSCQGTKTGARTNEWDLTAEHAVSCLCDEVKLSVNESGWLDDAEQIVSLLYCSQNEVARSRKPSKPIYIFALPANLTYNHQNIQHTIFISPTE